MAIAKIENKSYDELGLENSKNTLFFLDPPYEAREMTYNKNFELDKFLDWLQLINKNNNVIVYTDFENLKSDKLLNQGWIKFKIRDMQSTSPNRKNEDKTGNEVFYLNRKDLIS